MKWIYSLMIVLSLTAFKGGSDVDDFSLKDLDNQWVSYSEVKGEKLTVIDFWATWCKPCVNSIPKLNTVYSDFKDRGVQFIGINLDGPRNAAKVRPFSKSLGIDYPVLLDLEKDVAEQFKVSAIPSLFVIDADNKIVWRHEGFQLGDEDKLREVLENKLTKMMD